ncbi:hypothetical protein [Candidatus Pantoea soli]|uniref:hypothetical protein n=1 Tax=Candidatus Pantoea soli TaxID=3098669 RepID=UPI0011A5CB48|nr:hypothetical protein [Pantoea soli]
MHQITGYHAASPTSVAQFTIESPIIAKKTSEVIVVLITIYKPVAAGLTQRKVVCGAGKRAGELAGCADGAWRSVPPGLRTGVTLIFGKQAQPRTAIRGKLDVL